MINSKKFLTTLFFIMSAFASNVCIAQTNIDSILTESFSRLPDSYFVFNINPGIGANSNAHVIFNAYQGIIARTPCPDIFFVVDARQMPESQVPFFFDQVLRIPYKSYSDKIKYSSDLYNLLNKKQSLSLLYFIKNKKEYYCEPVKFTVVESLFFPCDMAHVVLEKKVQLPLEVPHTELAFMYAYKSKLLEISDADNTLRMINPETGQTERRFDPSTINGAYIYRKFIAKSKEEADFAEEERAFFAKKNRQEIPIYGAYVHKDLIYIYCGLQVMEMVKKEQKIGDGKGGVMTIKKGSPIGSIYGIFFICDSNLQMIDTLYLEDPKPKIWDVFTPEPAYMMYIQGDTLFCGNDTETDFTPKIRKSRYYNKGISIFTFEENKLTFEGVANAPAVENMEQKTYYWIDGHIFKWGNKLCVHYSTSPLMYEVFSGEVVGKLKGSSQEEKPDQFKSTLDDTLSIQVNWTFYEAAPIFNGEYMAFIYKHVNQVCIEILDKQFRSVQIIVMPDMVDFAPSNVVLSGNDIWAMRLETDAFYLYKYNIMK